MATSTIPKNFQHDIDTLNSKFTQTQITLGSYKSLSANWEYTGYSIVVPANHVYVCTLSTNWTAGRPTGLGVSQSTTLDGDMPYIAHAAETVHSTPCFFLYPGTWYVFARRAAAGSAANIYAARYFDLYSS